MERADLPPDLAAFLHPYRAKPHGHSYAENLHPRDPDGRWIPKGGAYVAKAGKNKGHVVPGAPLLEPEEQQRFKRELSTLVRGAHDPETFALATAMHEELGRALRERAAELTDPTKPKSQKYSWGDIAQALNVSRQAAFEKWGAKKRVRGPRKPPGMDPNLAGVFGLMPSQQKEARHG